MVGADLTDVTGQGGDALIDGFSDVFVVIGVVGPEEIEFFDAPRLIVGVELFGEEVPFARGPEAIQRGKTGGAVIGVELVAPPGVNRHEDVGFEFANDASQLTAQIQVVFQQTIGVA